MDEAPEQTEPHLPHPARRLVHGGPGYNARREAHRDKATDMRTSTVAAGYKGTTDLVARRRIQAQVVEAYRAHVASYVRKHVAQAHSKEAEQVGVIGVLVALEKYDAGIVCAVGGDRGAAFWNFARMYVRDEIRRWLDVGVFWCKSSNRGASDARRESAKMRTAQRTVESMDEPVGERETTLHDRIVDGETTVEDLVATAESRARLDQFLFTLTEADRHLLLCDKRDRGNANSVRSRHHLFLVGRATAFVRGKRRQ